MAHQIKNRSPWRARSTQVSTGVTRVRVLRVRVLRVRVLRVRVLRVLRVRVRVRVRVLRVRVLRVGAPVALSACACCA